MSHISYKFNSRWRSIVMLLSFNELRDFESLVAKKMEIGEDILDIKMTKANDNYTVLVIVSTTGSTEMLSDMEMAKAYRDAHDERFVLQYEHFKCVSDFQFSCGGCPAEASCRQLSQGKYSVFIKNFREQIFPLVQDEY